MSVLIKGMEMPTDCVTCRWHERWGCGLTGIGTNTAEGCPLVSIPTPHGRLIDEEALRAAMYHEAFETDTDLQRWDSGCWIRYRMFTTAIEAAPTIIEAEEDSHE